MRVAIALPAFRHFHYTHVQQITLFDTILIFTLHACKAAADFPHVFNIFVTAL